MMKKTLCMFLGVAALTAAAPSAQAQRRLPGQLAVEIGAGTVDGFSLYKRDGTRRFWASLGLVRYGAKERWWAFSAAYLQKDYAYKNEIVPKAQITGQVSFHFPFVRDRGGVFMLSGALSALAGYETSGWGNKLLHDGATLTDKDCFIYGGGVGLQAEAWLCDRLAFTVHASERIAGGSTIGVFHTLVGAGFKIIIH